MFEGWRIKIFTSAERLKIMRKSTLAAFAALTLFSGLAACAEEQPDENAELAADSEGGMTIEECIDRMPHKTKFPEATREACELRAARLRSGKYLPATSDDY